MSAMTPIDARSSSNAQPVASRTTYCPDVPAMDDPDVILFDFMSPAYLRVISNLPTADAVRWNKGASLAALSMDYYGTTTHWQTLLIYNGYIAASKIPPGATINIPDVSGLKSKMKTSSIGTVVKV